MATILTDLALRLYAQTSELKKGLKDAGRSAKGLQNETLMVGKKVSSNFKNMSKTAGGALSQISGSLVALGPAAGGAVGGLRSLSIAAAGLNVAMGPIGLIIGAIALAVKALSSYFKGSIDGAEKFAKIMGFLEGLLSFISDAFIKLGEIIVNAFENPKEAIANLWEFIKQNLVNRFQGMIDFFVAAFEVLKNGFQGLGKAIKGIFNDEARAEAQKYFQQMGTEMANVGKAAVAMATGLDVENIIETSAEAMKKLNEQTTEGVRIGALRKKLEWDTVYLALEESKIRRDMASLLLKTRDYEGTANKERMAALDELVKQEERLMGLKVKNAEDALALAKAELANSIDDEAGKKKVIEAQVKLNNVYKESDDKMRELVNRQNEMWKSTKKYVDAGITGWEDMTRVQAENAYTAWKVRGKLEEEAIQLELKDYKAMTDEELQLAIDTQVKINEHNKKLNDEWLSYKKAIEEEQAGESKANALAYLNKQYTEGLITTELYYAKKQDIINEWSEKEKESARQVAEEYRDAFANAGAGIEGFAAAAQAFFDKIKSGAQFTSEDIKAIVVGAADAMQSVTSQAVSFITSLWDAQKKKELEAAGSNAKKKEEIEKRFAQKQKKVAIAQALINGALGITKAIAQLGPIAGAIAAVLIGVTTAAQVATISAQTFAKGGIISGPTLGLMGEYPGARTNPEVVAPLDKLQRMIGGANGRVVFEIEYDKLVGVLNNGAQIKSAV